MRNPEPDWIARACCLAIVVIFAYSFFIYNPNSPASSPISEQPPSTITRSHPANFLSDTGNVSPEHDETAQSQKHDHRDAPHEVASSATATKVTSSATDDRSDAGSTTTPTSSDRSQPKPSQSKPSQPKPQPKPSPEPPPEPPPEPSLDPSPPKPFPPEPEPEPSPTEPSPEPEPSM